MIKHSCHCTCIASHHYSREESTFRTTCSRARGILVIRHTRSPVGLHRCLLNHNMKQLRCFERQPGALSTAPTFRRRVLRAPGIAHSAATEGNVGSIIPPADTSASRGSAVRRYEGVAYGGEVEWQMYSTNHDSGHKEASLRYKECICHQSGPCSAAEAEMMELKNLRHLLQPV